VELGEDNFVGELEKANEAIKEFIINNPDSDRSYSIEKNNK